MAVAMNMETELELGPETLLFERRDIDAGSASLLQYDVAPDNQRFLMRITASPPPRQLHVVLNWHQELTRLVPTDR